MANNETLSRPYTLALFEHSTGWLKDLEQIASVIREPKVTNLIDSPKISYQEKVKQICQSLNLKAEFMDSQSFFYRFNAIIRKN